jgi:hypothetical protein
MMAIETTTKTATAMIGESASIVLDAARIQSETARLPLASRAAEHRRPTL